VHGSVCITATTRHFLPRFWHSAFGFWKGPLGWWAWFLIVLLIAVAILQLLVQYWMNFWSRDFFDALSAKDSVALWLEAKIFVPLCVASTALAILSVWGKMTIQRQWREWLSHHLLEHWLTVTKYRGLKLVNGENHNAEYRIAEDARGATEAPIELALGLLASVLGAVTFMKVLWDVGGDLTVHLFGQTLVLQGYLVIAAVVYSIFITLAMMFVGRHLTEAVEAKNQTEAEFRSAASRLRYDKQYASAPKSSAEKRRAVDVALSDVTERWGDLCWQLMSTTVVSHGTFLVAPVLALMLCAPKYLAGSMSLGEVVQASAAFVTVQSAFNWLVDNYHYVADWRSSVNRVGSLLDALDEVEKANKASSPPAGFRITA